MAIKWPLANGVWSNAANWNGGTLPDVGDDVHADGKTVTIDQDVTVLSIRTTQRSGGTAGGGFIMPFPFNGSGDIIAGTTTCLTYTANGVNWIGNSNGGIGGSAHGINNTGTGTLNITGNITGGSNTTSHGLRNSSTGTLNITGNCTGGSGNTATGVLNFSTGSINITGNCTGGSLNAATGVYNQGTGLVIITGSSIGGNEITAFGAGNFSIGTINSLVAVGGLLAPGLSGALIGGITSVKNIIFGSAGQSPVAGFIKFENGTDNTATILKRNATTAILSDTNSNTYPITSNVRSGISYNSGALTGTLIVPDPSNVRKGVPTDATVGTADLTAEDFWTYATRSLTESTGATPAEIWTYENRSLTEAPDVPTAEEIATQVWTDQPDRLKNVSTVETTGDQISTI